jgi:hypothetical protein
VVAVFISPILTAMNWRFGPMLEHSFGSVRW